MLTLALIQMLVGPDPGENLNRAAHFVEEAAAAGAQVVALPEMFVCPYANDAFSKFAEAEKGPVYQALSEMAKQSGVWLFGGSVPERDAAGKIYNTCYVFDPEGQAAGRHRKVHLFDIDIPGGQRFKESDTLSAGSELCLVETPYGKIGVQICFDIRFMEWSRLLADAGADLILVPGAFNMTTGPRHWELLMRARALDNQLFVAAVSPARDRHAPYVAYGHSLLADPWGEVLHRLDEQEGILVATIDTAVAAEVRAQLPVLSARRKDLYALKGAGDSDRRMKK